MLQFITLDSSYFQLTTFKLSISLELKPLSKNIIHLSNSFDKNCQRSNE